MSEVMDNVSEKEAKAREDQQRRDEQAKKDREKIAEDYKKVLEQIKDGKVKQDQLQAGLLEQSNEMIKKAIEAQLKMQKEQTERMEQQAQQLRQQIEAQNNLLKQQQEQQQEHLRQQQEQQAKLAQQQEQARQQQEQLRQQQEQQAKLAQQQEQARQQPGAPAPGAGPDADDSKDPSKDIEAERMKASGPEQKAQHRQATAKLADALEQDQQKLQVAKGANGLGAALDEKKALADRFHDLDAQRAKMEEEDRRLREKREIEEIARRTPEAKVGDLDGRSVQRPRVDEAVGRSQDRWQEHERGQRELIDKLGKVEEGYGKALKEFREHVSQHGVMQEKQPDKGATPDQLKEHRLLQERQLEMVKNLDKMREDAQKLSDQIKMNDLKFNQESWGRIGQSASFCGDDRTKQRAESEQEKIKERLKEMREKHGIDQDDPEKQKQKGEAVSEAYLKNKIDPLSKNGLTQQQSDELKNLQEMHTRRLESRADDELKHRIKQSR